LLSLEWDWGPLEHYSLLLSIIWTKLSLCLVKKERLSRCVFFIFYFLWIYIELRTCYSKVLNRVTFSRLLISHIIIKMYVGKICHYPTSKTLFLVVNGDANGWISIAPYVHLPLLYLNRWSMTNTTQFYAISNINLTIFAILVKSDHKLLFLFNYIIDETHHIIAYQSINEHPLVRNYQN
jgi:hypothetical protein